MYDTIYSDTFFQNVYNSQLFNYDVEYLSTR